MTFYVLLNADNTVNFITSEITPDLTDYASSETVEAADIAEIMNGIPAEHCAWDPVSRTIYDDRYLENDQYMIDNWDLLRNGSILTDEQLTDHALRVFEAMAISDLTSGDYTFKMDVENRELYRNLMEAYAEDVKANDALPPENQVTVPVDTDLVVADGTTQTVTISDISNAVMAYQIRHRALNVQLTFWNANAKIAPFNPSY